MSNFENIKKLFKTLLIKDAYNPNGNIKLIIRPRRFGKTLNMDMIREFYSIYEKDLFDGLKMMNKKDSVKEHYHKYFVVFVFQGH